MIKRELIDSAQIPGGDELQLFAHGRDFVIMCGRIELMGTRMQFSEEQLARLTMERLQVPEPRILIGGYGMGFTLRQTLSLLPARGAVVVAELVPEIVEWARGPLASLTGDSLSDPRLRLEIGDVAESIQRAAMGAEPRYDAILLDVDNGPDGLVREENDRIYAKGGLEAARAALAPGGMLAVWSAAPDPQFTRRLARAGFAVDEQTVRARPNNKGPRHTIWFASRR